MLKSPSVNKLPGVNTGAKSRFSYPRGNTRPCPDVFPVNHSHLVKTNTMAQEKTLSMLTAAFSLHDEHRCFMMAPFYRHHSAAQTRSPVLRTRYKHVLPQLPSVSIAGLSAKRLLSRRGLQIKKGCWVKPPDSSPHWWWRAAISSPVPTSPSFFFPKFGACQTQY